jgi:cyclin-dependent kinase-like
MLSALKHMHSRKIVHRDIKPENLMVTQNGTLKLVDMGSARAVSQSQMTEYICTRWYRAPELLVNAHYSEAIDIWAVGCIFVELLTGRPLFNGKNEQDTLRLILQTFHNTDN